MLATSVAPGQRPVARSQRPVASGQRRLHTPLGRSGSSSSCQATGRHTSAFYCIVSTEVNLKQESLFLKSIENEAGCAGTRLQSQPEEAEQGESSNPAAQGRSGQYSEATTSKPETKPRFKYAEYSYCTHHVKKAQ